jgi:hypothetical protein
MRNLIRNVSHNSRCAPLSTVNFAMKPLRPVASSGGTVSSGGITSLVIWPTGLNYSVIPGEVEASRGMTLVAPRDLSTSLRSLKMTTTQHGFHRDRNVLLSPLGAPRQ